jgi:hypothetical protein
MARSLVGTSKKAVDVRNPKTPDASSLVSTKAGAFHNSRERVRARSGNRLAVYGRRPRLALFSSLFHVSLR